MNSNLHKTRSIFFYIVNTILLFLYIYMFNLIAFGFPLRFHSQRLSAVCIIIYGVIAHFRASNKFLRANSPISSKEFKKYSIICFILLFYGLLLLLSIGKENGTHFFETMLNICLFTIPVAWALVKIYRNADEFMIVLVLVGIVQSFFIICSLANDSFATMLDLTFNDVVGYLNTTSSHRSEYAGGLGCIAAPGVIKYSTGLIASCYLYGRKRKTYLLFLFTIFAILSSMIARTGLLLDAVCMCYLLIISTNKRVFFKFAIPVALIIIALISLVETGKYTDFLSERYARMEKLQENGAQDEFFGGYFSGVYPPIKSDTFFGVGMVSGTSGNGYVVDTDGGFLRIYSAIGILFSLLIYFYFIGLLYKNTQLNTDHNNRLFMWLIAIIYLLADFKEITFFIVYPMCIYFAITILIERDEHVEYHIQRSN